MRIPIATDPVDDRGQTDELSVAVPPRFPYKDLFYQAPAAADAAAAA